jgi:DNA-binding NtrC family response regulator/tetratricopeptide (TPR) repeat protein
MKEDAVRLVADRFAVDDEGRALDLATGDRVRVRVGAAGGVSEQLRWAERCATFHALHHRAIARLLDFGPLGESSRFEAWACEALSRGSRELASSVHAAATRFLHASGLTSAGLMAESMQRARNGAEVWVPPDDSGYLRDGDAPADSLPLSDRGLRFVERRAVAALAEMFQGTHGTRPHVSALWGAPGSGKHVVVRLLARFARIHGFVPVASQLIGSRYAELWRGRSLFVIAEGTSHAPWSAFLDAALRTSQPHGYLIVGENECRSVHGIALGRLSADALLSAVRPEALTPALEQEVRRAAERSRGLPGRFVQLLWPESTVDARRKPPARASCLSRVAEQPAVYGRADAADEMFVAAPAPVTWPAPGELASLRRRMDGALAQIASGRHAPGVRALRQAIGGLARRGAWADAGGGALGLVRVLLRRGRARDAQAVLEDARQYATRAGHEPMLVDLAILSGEAWIDLGRLDEAEGVLGTALAAARAAQDPARGGGASLSLARCLYWRGQYADAQDALRAAPEAAALPARVRHRLIGSRIAVGLVDFSGAMSLVTEARQDAANERGLQAAAAYAAAFVHLAVGDLDAVEREVAESIIAARLAHDPLRAVRARLLRAEAERRRGRTATAAAQLHRLRRLIATASSTVRSRWELAMAVASADGDPGDVVARHASATGLGALALYVAAPRAVAAAGAGSDPFVAQIVAILELCHTAEDEVVLLTEICARVRQQLHAAAVAFTAVRGGRAHVITADGARLDTDIAERAACAGITIAPHRHDDRIDAAAPVLYGGTPIGALCARWALGSTYDISRAAPVLTMSAAAAAPMVAAAIAKQLEPAVGGSSDLLGITAAMRELRQGVERAAGAPFSVLIDGESGSGKELVARAIHRGGSRRHKPFCTLNCAALPDDLVESELFGHARGAFTGAVGDRTGVFEDAHAGTLFLDEIGELSARAQAKVLRVIQEGELRRVGETASRRIDVRIVSATNRDLRAEVGRGGFRLDLLYRLDVVHITVPPLRERREDIAVLAEHFWRDATARVGSRATLGAATIAALARYDWPGNVRELQNILAALAVRSPKRGVVPPSALPAPFAGSGRHDAWRLDEARRTFEERFVRAALVRTGGHRGRAASELGVTRQGLTKLMMRLGISP